MVRTDTGDEVADGHRLAVLGENGEQRRDTVRRLGFEPQRHGHKEHSGVEAHAVGVPLLLKVLEHALQVMLWRETGEAPGCEF